VSPPQTFNPSAPVVFTFVIKPHQNGSLPASYSALSREELEVMLNLDSLKKSRVYQEGREEGKQEGKQEGFEEGALETNLKTIPRLMKLGLSIEQIAESLEMDVEIVRKNAQQ